MVLLGKGEGGRNPLEVDANILTCAFFLGRAYLGLPQEM